MHPELVQMLMTERARERREFAAAWRQRRVRRPRLLRRRPRQHPAWKTRTV